MCHVQLKVRMPHSGVFSGKKEVNLVIRLTKLLELGVAGASRNRWVYA